MLKKSKKNYNKTSASLMEKVMAFDLEQSVKSWLNAQSLESIFAFWSAFVLGFITHIYVFTNRFMNEDDVAIRYVGANVASGRWFNGIIRYVTFELTPPAAIGFLQILFIALSAFLVVKAFNVSGRVSAFLIGGLMVTFPSIAHTNGYLYEAGGYYFASLLAVAAFYLTKKYKFGFVLAGFMIMLSMSIYQSKIGVTLPLFLISLIFTLLADDFDIKRFLNDCVKFVTATLLGGALYFISVRLSTQLNNTTLNAYRGISEMYRINVLNLPILIEKTYHDYIRFFLTEEYLPSSYLVKVNIVAAIVASLLILGIILRQKIHRQPVRLSLLLACLALMPFAANFAAFFTPSRSSILMVYGFVMTFVFCVMLSAKIKQSIVSASMAISILVIIVNYMMLSNVFYLQLDMYYQRTFSLTTRLLSRIEPLLPLSESRTIAMIGNMRFNPEYPRGTHFPFQYGEPSNPGLWGQFIGYNSEQTNKLVSNLSNRHGVHNLRIANPDKMREVRHSALAMDMPIFPLEGSVALIDDIIVVKLAPVAAIDVTPLEGGMHRVSVSHSKSQDSDGGYLYAWYIYRDASRIDIKWYEPGLSEFDYELTEGGEYRFQVFIRTSDNQDFIPSAFSNFIRLETP